MTVTDLYGKELFITDLQKAINQAEKFKEYRHADNTYQNIDKERSAYWSDLYNKLCELKNQINNTKS